VQCRETKSSTVHPVSFESGLKNKTCDRFRRIPLPTLGSRTFEGGHGSHRVLPGSEQTFGLTFEDGGRWSGQERSTMRDPAGRDPSPASPTSPVHVRGLSNRAVNAAQPPVALIMIALGGIGFGVSRRSGSSRAWLTAYAALTVCEVLVVMPVPPLSVRVALRAAPSHSRMLPNTGWRFVSVIM